MGQLFKCEMKPNNKTYALLHIDKDNITGTMIYKRSQMSNSLAESEANKNTAAILKGGKKRKT